MSRHLKTLLTASISCAPFVAFAQTAPANDEFGAATVVNSYPFTETENTVYATPGAEDANSWYGSGPTVWFAYTPDADGEFEVNTTGSDYDTTVSAFVVDAGSLWMFAGNDDSNGTLQSTLLVQGLAGETYYFMVGGYGGGMGGNLTFFLGDPAPPPPPLEFSFTVDSGTVVSSNGQVTVSGTATCSRPSFVSLSGSLKQARGRDAIFANFSAGAPCNGTVNWSGVAWSNNQLFHGRSAALFTPGRVTFDAYGNAFSGWEAAFDAASGGMMLRSTRR